MPSLKVQFTDDELAVVRAAADLQGMSLEAYLHDVVMAAVSSRKQVVAQAARRVAAISSELNDRLPR